MGYAHGGICHNTLEAAALNACASAYPVAAVVPGSLGSAVYVQTDCTGVNASGGLTIVKRTQGQLDQTFTATVGFPACDWADFPGNPAFISPTDGAIVAGAIVSLWGIAFGFRALVGVLKDSTNSEA